MQKLARCAALSFLMITGGMVNAFAQAEGVLERPRPEYDPKGLPLGGFRLFPTASISVGVDDNVLRQPVATTRSMVVQEKGSFLLRSEWSRHALGLFGDVTARQYADLPAEDTVDWTIGGNGRVDIQRGSDIAGSGFYSKLHEPRNSPELPGFAAEPTAYQMTGGQVSLSYNPYKFGFKVGANINRYTYDPTLVIAPGAPISNADRDRQEYDLYARANYEFSPGYAIFVQGNYIAQEFDLALDRNGVNRTTDGYRGNIGASLQISRLLRGEAYIGYLKQDYKGALTDISGLNFGGSLDWYADEALTVHLRASRLLSATTLFGASANDSKTFAVSADYELLRNVLILPSYSYTNSTFTGLGRDDDLHALDLGIRYLLTETLSADFNYSYETRRSTSPTGSYDDNILRVGLNLRL